MLIGYRDRPPISPGGEKLLAGPLARRVPSVAFYCAAGAEPPLGRPSGGRAERNAAVLFCVYLDFQNAFNSIDHEALWWWLKELNIPDVDLLHSLYSGAY